MKTINKIILKNGNRFTQTMDHSARLTKEAKDTFLQQQAESLNNNSFVYMHLDSGKSLTCRSEDIDSIMTSFEP